MWQRPSDTPSFHHEYITSCTFSRVTLLVPDITMLLPHVCIKGRHTGMSPLEGAFLFLGMCTSAAEGASVGGRDRWNVISAARLPLLSLSFTAVLHHLSLVSQCFHCLCPFSGRYARERDDSPARSSEVREAFDCKEYMWRFSYSGKRSLHRPDEALVRIARHQVR
ncbi:hypothetical protein EJ06DRAFT_109870 [Trichodelitschia bisporula]|uniref:Uncharacterized protein n=1 Tax=Trichodelitschia bisporula TaxID=703511 RepID=A0A6G1HRU5_9PEZI|nr:hypothetical protein EJ06DRAFT_109870 [Trichodelitschia bisporula]